ncbi:homeotic protein caudal-like isoform X4 [Pseudomyrmex gracilis]|nr:homeotic protein caudal-like isoform X4 [Pseudomyrmex gracilis]
MQQTQQQQTLAQQQAQPYTTMIAATAIDNPQHQLYGYPSKGSSPTSTLPHLYHHHHQTNSISSLLTAEVLSWSYSGLPTYQQQLLFQQQPYLHSTSQQLQRNYHQRPSSQQSYGGHSPPSLQQQHLQQNSSSQQNYQQHQSPPQNYQQQHPSPPRNYQQHPSPNYQQNSTSPLNFQQRPSPQSYQQQSSPHQSSPQQPYQQQQSSQSLPLQMHQQNSPPQQQMGPGYHSSPPHQYSPPQHYSPPVTSQSSPNQPATSYVPPLFPGVPMNNGVNNSLNNSLDGSVDGSMNGSIHSSPSVASPTEIPSYPRGGNMNNLRNAPSMCAQMNLPSTSTAIGPISPRALDIPSTSRRFQPCPRERRQPYDWMKKTSYQSQPKPVCNAAGNPDSPSSINELCCRLETIGKTRTKDKYRVVYSEFQRLELEKEFRTNHYINITRKIELAGQLDLTERQVKIWFQNRRAKERKEEKKRKEQTAARNREQEAAAQVAVETNRLMSYPTAEQMGRMLSGVMHATTGGPTSAQISMSLQYSNPSQH